MIDSIGECLTPVALLLLHKSTHPASARDRRTQTAIGRCVQHAYVSWPIQNQGKTSKAILISESNQKSKQKKSKDQSSADSAVGLIDSPRHLLLFSFMALDRLITLACVAPFSLCCWLLLFLPLAHAPYAHRRSGEMYRSPMNAQMSSSRWKMPSGLLGLRRRLPVSRSKMACCVRSRGPVVALVRGFSGWVWKCHGWMVD